MEIHAGSRPDGPLFVFNKPRDLVNKIAEPLFGYGCNSWFTNIDLVDELKKKLFYVGTVRRNKR